MALPASPEHILKEIGLRFSSSVPDKNTFFIFELLKQTSIFCSILELLKQTSIFCSILTGMGLEFDFWHQDVKS